MVNHWMRCFFLPYGRVVDHGRPMQSKYDLMQPNSIKHRVPNHQRLGPPCQFNDAVEHTRGKHFPTNPLWMDWLQRLRDFFQKCLVCNHSLLVRGILSWLQSCVMLRLCVFWQSVSESWNVYSFVIPWHIDWLIIAFLSWCIGLKRTFHKII